MTLRVAHVSLYPPKGAKHVEGSGVISYTKNLVAHIDKTVEQHVLTNRIDGQTETYQEDGVTVHRCFDRGPLFVRRLHTKLQEIRPDVVHIQQELALFGGVATAYLLQWLVFAWGERTVLTMHHVVDPAKVDRAFVRQNSSNAPATLVRLAFRAIFAPPARRAKRVIVHAPVFKDVVASGYYVTPDQIAVIPHGVEDLRAQDAVEARRKLQVERDAKVVLYMGYATGYKGLDLLLEGFGEYAKSEPNALLIVGAGKHPKLLNNAAYLAKYQRWQDKAAELVPKDQYRWVGFIDEDEVSDYYSAADVSVYPYTTALSSSGPMALAIGYEKPFLASRAFEGIFGGYPQLLFDQTHEALADKLRSFFEHQTAYQNLSSELKAPRIWGRVGEATTKVYQAVKVANDQRHRH